VQSPSLTFRLGTLAALVAALAGCGGTRYEAPDTSLTALTDPGARGTRIETAKQPKTAPGDLSVLAEQAAIDLQHVLDSGTLNRPLKTAVPAATNPPAESASSTQAEVVGPPLPPELPTAAPIADLPTPPPEDPLLELAKRMASLLRDQGEGRAKFPDAVALAPIEAMQPGVLADLESPKNALGPKLTIEDRRALTDARDRILAQPGAANESLTKTLAKLAPPPSLKIGRAVLCTKVKGFGSYDPLNTDTFVVGRAIRAIVYIELDGFMSRPARASDPIDPALSLADQVSVELSQSITLFHDPSGLQAKFIPWKTVVDTSRNKRRDFYLIQQIVLPESLTIGRYNLKITVKDVTSGSEAEAVMPINLVADASALTRLK
jgi:hypothetical protein